MRFPTELEFDAINETLHYDPTTGEIRWDRTGKRVVTGELAGSISRDGHLVVTIRGRQYQGSHLAWFLHTGFWPTSLVGFKNGDTLDLLPGNLYLYEDRLPPTQKALEMRRYREKVKERQKSIASTSKVPNVAVGYDKVTWTVRASWDARIVLASFTDPKAAESYGLQCLAGREYIQRYQVPYDYVLEDTEAEHIFAGPADILSLGEAHRRFAYDPVNGMIYNRAPERRRGTPAIHRQGHKRLVVNTRGRVYTAGMMAWFLTHGEWPRRKRIAYRDNDQKNIKLDNLYLKGEIE